MFPGLEKLRIRYCPLLKSTPNQFEILRELTIKRDDSEMPSLNLCSNLTSLVELSVFAVKELTCFPDENYLTSLQVLYLWNCDGLASLPSGILEQCQSLQNLRVNYWGLHHLTRLRELEISPFSDMVDFEAFQLTFNGIHQLLSLRSLLVFGHLHWDSLPYQLMQFSALTHISICDFGIKALPHRPNNLTSLEILHLKLCRMGLATLLLCTVKIRELRKTTELEHLPSKDAM
ncbi:hypothetical protein H5410_053291 [Solanum commersonii]|uniref:Uncharacterized protein n=1 Tax=Solanum commersonii TaxID=4109 RepID=A0A9J5X6N6_SOLCO|nr:hypothetical protein H5410_053291 [Solanum commersonii]